ncbi:hypothetical protein Tsubulata_028376 [Turnera subulata]|uniref:Histone-lysine N-methyltransferase n=1 Tax=Turnera subulata TaxID=218843 RepID=A0A9Q0FCF1_9ROSI|nr:hypothetical protein Tsubulata_028376 [Turnera subulata]
MPCLKGCTGGEDCSEDEEGYAYRFIPKKRKMSGYYNPTGLCNGISDFSGGSGSGCSEGPYWENEVRSNSRPAKGGHSRPPLLKSSRGRAQRLPSRFNDSVLDESGSNLEEDEFSDCRDDFDSNGLGFGKLGSGEDKFGFGRPNSSYQFKGFEYRNCGTKYLSTRKRYPWWPAVVIDPILNAPEAVLSCCVPGAICLMFYGYSKNGTQRDYAWVKQGMIFPFAEFMDRFQGQTEMYKYKLSDFQMALEEAILAESGLLETNSCTVQTEYPETYLNGLQEDRDLYAQNQGACHQDLRCCDGCNLILPCKTMKRRNGSTFQIELLCKHCFKLRKSIQYCGICKKTWHHSDGGSWVCCDGCNVWVHAECDNISGKLLKDLEHIDYFCPDCKLKFKLQSQHVERRKPPAKSITKNGQSVPADKLTVVCNGMEGTYFPKLYLQVLKTWREALIAECNSHGVDTLKLDKEKLLTFLQAKYEPVNAKWTTERCAVCRWVEDWDYNKIIICNKCQIAVHQECYGVCDVQDFTSWVCRACETPDVERECCLCTVKGTSILDLFRGALKPTDVDPLWVYVICAWFQPEIGFLNHEKMEPATGIFRVPSTLLSKGCVICKQTHGSCAQCCKCSTYFHVTCALRAGYFVELHCTEKDGIQFTKKLIYCASHRTPSPDSVVVIRTSSRVFAARSLLPNQKECFKGSRLISSKRMELSEPTNSENNELVPHSAARCHDYRRSGNMDTEDSRVFSSFKERLYHLQKTECYRVCFGKSGIHGWVLFARCNIQDGEMAIEYRGEQVRRSVADLRERRSSEALGYGLCGKFNEACPCWTTQELLRLLIMFLNPVCMLNCYARIMSVGKLDNRIVLVAKKNVSAGDELTYDYLFDPDEHDELKVPCLCKAPNCRKFMN